MLACSDSQVPSLDERSTWSDSIAAIPAMSRRRGVSWSVDVSSANVCQVAASLCEPTIVQNQLRSTASASIASTSPLSPRNRSAARMFS